MKIIFQNPALTDKLVSLTINQAMQSPSGIHGPSHWIRVERNGLFLASGTGVNIDLISYFALFHDCRRLTDGHDGEHGPRAAQFIRELFNAGDLPVKKEELDRLCFACKRHTHQRHHTDPLIQICWDADRLDLTRIGVNPAPEFLNTDKAKHLAMSGKLYTLDEYQDPGFQKLKTP